MGFWQFATGGGSGGGTGDVVGPASSTDNAIARFDGATGKLLQNSDVTVSDLAAGAVTITAGKGTAITLKNTNPDAAAGASVAGDAFTLESGDAVASTDTDGAAAGGAVNINAGDAARRNSGNANGGDINLTTGAGIGTGTTGKVVLPSAAGLNWSTDTGLARSAAGIAKVTDGSTGAGALLIGTAFNAPTGLKLDNGSGHGAALYGRNSGVLGFTSISGTIRRMELSDGALSIASDYLIYWTGEAKNVVTATVDLGLARIAAGQLAVQNAANGMANNIKIATTTVNASGATSTATNLVPAGCILLGVTTRVTTAITSGDGGTSVNIGNGTDADMYGAAIAFALGTTTNLASHTASALAFKSAAESVVFTCNGGTFSGGVWRVCAHYLDLTSPTS